jgi:dipeptidyl aminopeptidase/acylaminoacyl peptidase
MRNLAVKLALVGSIFITGAQLPAASRNFTVDDYYRVQRVVELVLSDDGLQVVYVTCGCNTFSETAAPRRAYLQDVAAGAIAEQPDALQGVFGIAWLPGSTKLGFIAPDSHGVHQIFEYDLAHRARKQLTFESVPVRRFKFAPDGSTFAYTTSSGPEMQPSLYRRFQEDSAGVAADPDDISLYDFVDPTPSIVAKAARSKLWAVKDGVRRQVSFPGDIEAAQHAGELSWSHDSRFLSFSFVDARVEESSMRGMYTSLGLYDILADRVVVLGSGLDRSANGQPISYLGGEWVPGQHKLWIRRWIETDPWVSGSFPEVAVVDVRGSAHRVRSWRTLETYSPDEFFPVRLTPLGASKAILEDTRNGIHGVYSVDLQDSRDSQIGLGQPGSSSHVRFARRTAVKAFVNESITRPPEVFFQVGSRSPVQLSTINSAVPAPAIDYERMVWRSTDGTEVSGWLIRPARGSRETAPLLTYVHGGPSEVVRDAFTSNFRNWPYPLELFAQQGYLVFIPNYRGTKTFGRSFASPETQDGTPVEDVVTGVEAVIRKSNVDRGRIGILGHSHGAWLGPMALTRSKLFSLGAFAEGAPNVATAFEMMPGALNRRVHAYSWNGSLYDNPSRYAELSPALHFRGQNAAFLFEAGARSVAPLMMSYPKAAQHAGLPSEFVIYPRTGHAFTDPTLGKLAAIRNLDWVSFWFGGRTPTLGFSSDGIDRWQELRRSYCSSSEQRKLSEICARP